MLLWNLSAVLSSATIVVPQEPTTSPKESQVCSAWEVLWNLVGRRRTVLVVVVWREDQVQLCAVGEV